MKILHFFAASWFVALLGLASFCFAANPQSLDDRKINGQVIVADGTPVAGATVQATQDCFHGGDAIETRKTISAADGTFSLPAYDTRCSHYRLLASKEEDFWLPTDDLMNSQFGPTPSQRIVVDISSVTPSRPVIVVLNARGGKVAIRVRDVATGRFVFADLVYEKPDQDKVLGASMPTGLDGSATVHLLPPGEYTVEVFSFSCGDSHQEWHVTADGPKIFVLVRSGIELNQVIEIDSRKIKIRKNSQGKLGSDSSSPNCSRQDPEETRPNTQ
jgi:hypothetical protein